MFNIKNYLSKQSKLKRKAMNLIKKTAIAFSLFAFVGSTAVLAQTKEPVKTTVKKDAKKVEQKANTTAKKMDAKATKDEKAVKTETTKKTDAAKKDVKATKKDITSKANTTKKEVKNTNVAKTSKAGTYNGHKVYVGERGGKYYINSNGNKTYIK